MALLAWERRTAVDGSVQITSEHVLDHASNHDLFRPHVRELDPVIQEVVSYPEDGCVGALTTLLLATSRRFLDPALRKLTRHNPVVLVDAINFAEQFEADRTAQFCELLDRLLQQHYLLLAERNTRPFQHLSLLLQVRHGVRVIAQKLLVEVAGGHLLVKKCLSNFSDLGDLALAHLLELVCNLSIKLRVKHGVLLRKICFLNDDGNFLKFFKAIVRVILHDA